MARPRRIQCPGLVYHITARGNRRQAIYLDDQDRQKFLTVLDRTSVTQGVVCHAYCLMPNHYHLVAKFHNANLSRVIQVLNGTYAQWWNRRHQQVGHVFQGRYGAQVIEDDDYFLAACRYVVRNPVRAGFVTCPDHWRWSSYAASLGLAPALECQDKELIGRFHSNGDYDAALSTYRQFMSDPDAPAHDIPHKLVVGTESFLARFREVPNTLSPEFPRSERFLSPRLATLFSSTYTRELRTTQMAEAVRHGYSMAEIARFLGVHYSTVSKALRQSAAS